MGHGQLHTVGASAATRQRPLQRSIRRSGRDYPRVGSTAVEVATGADHRGQAGCLGPAWWDVDGPGPDVAVDA